LGKPQNWALRRDLRNGWSVSEPRLAGEAVRLPKDCGPWGACRLPTESRNGEMKNIPELGQGKRHIADVIRTLGELEGIGKDCGPSGLCCASPQNRPFSDEKGTIDKGKMGRH